jgi:putative FmdB family regulatory protein
MPTYQYRCTDCGTDLEAVQKFTDPALTECPTCHGSLRKVFNAVGVVFKGSGFYRTDSRPKEGASSGSSGGSNGESKSESKTKESTNGAGGDKKSSDSGSGSSGSSGSGEKKAPAKAASTSSTGSSSSS